ncbi:MAG: hypothetical protein LBL83_07520 [Clostridiales bacterium]|nr:hypothetical protein [Clostridiales bacterium]
MKRKALIIAIAAFAAAAIAGLAVFFALSPYSGYSGAFDKTARVNGTEYATEVKMTVDGQTTEATGSFKIRDIATKVNFVNVMSIGGAQVTQFTDGDYIYVDDGQAKSKFKIGEKTQQAQKAPGEFSMDSYIQEFSGLLDASRIKDLKIAEKLDQRIIEKITKKSLAGGGAEYSVTLAAQLVDDIFASVVGSESGGGGADPSCSLKSFSYTATANGANYIDSIAYRIDLDATFPDALTGSGDQTRSMQIDLSMKVVNPGAPAEFSLPDASGYQEL